MKLRNPFEELFALNSIEPGYRILLEEILFYQFKKATF